MDWWAIGVILYEFIVGIPPFNDDSIEKIWKNITEGKIEWPRIGYEEDCMSPEAKDLISKLLDLDPQNRIKTLKEFERHSFFNTINYEELKNQSVPCSPSFNFVNLMKLKGKSFEEIFESDNSSEKKCCYNQKEFKKDELVMIRTDLLHEQNLNKLDNTL